jgi:predicted dehydrogenase
MKTIAVIGQGLWGKKIIASVRKYRSNFETECLSSRKFISEPPSTFFDVIWIASRPSEQLEILKTAKSMSQVFILEKPICASLHDYSQVRKILENPKTRIELSRPWSFSSTWLKAREIVKSWDLTGSSVTFERKGPAAHSYITSIEDWLPHDVYLASDLFPAFDTKFSLNSFESGVSDLALSLKSQEGTALNFIFSEDESKKSTVEVSSDDGKLFIDFIENCVEVNGKISEVIDPDELDAINRILDSALYGDISRSNELVCTQEWMKSLIDQRK